MDFHTFWLKFNPGFPYFFRQKSLFSLEFPEKACTNTKIHTFFIETFWISGKMVKEFQTFWVRSIDILYEAHFQPAHTTFISIDRYDEIYNIMGLTQCNSYSLSFEIVCLQMYFHIHFRGPYFWRLCVFFFSKE